MSKKKIPTERMRVMNSKDNGGWKQWGPYLSERQWGTVREDYSHDGSAWDFFPHDHARSRTYRWGEDGILGISDNKQNICFALAMWNGKDPIIKERLFGLNGKEGNHAEDVKEYYYYLESTPTHSYMKGLYKYPQNEFPYSQLVYVNRQRTKNDPEFELIDTGIFDNDEYFDVFVEYAKGEERDILIEISVFNRSSKEATLHLLPTVWYRNTWAWGYSNEKPQMKASKKGCISIQNFKIGDYQLHYEGKPEILFCDNETNYKKLFGSENTSEFLKDGINDYVVHGKKEAVNPKKVGTKASLKYDLKIAGGEVAKVRLRLTQKQFEDAFSNFDSVFEERKQECDDFYEWLQKPIKNKDEKMVQRQSYAGLMWTKQYFYFNVNQWLNGDPSMPPPPEQRKHGRNSNWRHLSCENIIHMPDKWEYPWFAAWDTAFHTIPICRIDPWFAKRQLEILLREYYMHP
ncbi:MAG: glucosidase, partial [Cytophagales bacterium]